MQFKTETYLPLVGTFSVANLASCGEILISWMISDKELTDEELEPLLWLSLDAPDPKTLPACFLSTNCFPGSGLIDVEFTSRPSAFFLVPWSTEESLCDCLLRWSEMNSLVSCCCTGTLLRGSGTALGWVVCCSIDACGVS